MSKHQFACPHSLGFAVLLKFYTLCGRFPRGRGELADEAVEFVARQVGVPAAELGLYGWVGRSAEYHRAQIRRHLGFRECAVVDADKLTAWLAADVCQAERQPDRVRGSCWRDVGPSGSGHPPPAAWTGSSARACTRVNRR
jgi:hypothetical protein